MTDSEFKKKCDQALEVMDKITKELGKRFGEASTSIAGKGSNEPDDMELEKLLDEKI